LRPTLIRLMLVALLAFGAVAFVAACGSDDKSSSSGSSSSSSSSTKKKIKIGLVTDTGGLNDRSFNALAYQGLKRAKADLGADIRVVPSTKNADYVPNLSSLARQKFDLIVANGFLMSAATEKVAKAFPGVQFAIIDYSQAAMKSKPKNVHGLLFKEQEGGYLVGYMAGLYAKKKGGKQVISSVGGQSIDPVNHYIAGYQAGAKKANPGIKTLNDYSEDFNDQAKCKEIALNHIGQGAQVVFAVAGGCGLGALDAAKEKGVQAIGVDADQSYVGPQVMTSALKKVDNAVFESAKELQDGSFKGGTDTVFDLKEGGIGVGKVSPAGQPFESDVKKVQSQIADGSVTPPNKVTK
jgi:basic membrane protein A